MIKSEICEVVLAALSEGLVCEETEYGSRVITHCLYPSHEPVHVFVSRWGEGYRVTDAGMASSNAWLHGRDDLHKLLVREATRFNCRVADKAIEAEVPSAEWLKAAILAVANASASAAATAVERSALAAEAALSERVFSTLSRVFHASHIKREFEYKGSSGKHWRADFFIHDRNKALLINSVTPHHISISAKYVAFADMHASESILDLTKVAVFERELGADDVALMSQVADLVPISTLEPGIRRIAHWGDGAYSTLN